MATIYPEHATLNAQRHISRSSHRLMTSTERLSSGLRINRAADDAAGLAVSEGMKARIRALDQAARNAADGISLVQVADGALQEHLEVLARMRVLAEQALTGTVTDDQRALLNTEYNALRSQLNTIAWGTTFNGKDLLDGSGGTVGIQVGIETTAGNTVGVDLSNDVDIVALSLTADLSSAGTALTAMAQIIEASREVVAVRSGFGATQNRLESSIKQIHLAAENLSAANSRIRDADLALETSSHTRSRILVEAGTSILARSGRVRSLALQLLR